ncbi:O-antigen ligase family protein [Microbacterium sp. Au-Mic1]|uniref:O-antigen ligase family protein n=1 Tax=Microbacterium sp. Au-Mic1 TaxID=2906457 RepID=UPI001E2F5026|nr:O-antigen ligase family protein [Microbacterium sp. Au-Mic1]MCE4027328.1 O-antigen ligase family protein [Microbacterium sp. Au-Mic1]
MTEVGSRPPEDATGPRPITRIGLVLVALIAPVSVLNPVLPHLGPVSAFTGFAALFFIYGITHMQKRQPDGLRQLVAILCLPVLVISLLAVVNSFNVQYVFAQAVVVSGGVFITLGLLALPSSRDLIRSLLFGWLVASLCTSCLALIEITTGRHFGATYLDANPDATKLGVVTVFYNPNNYAAFLALTIPLLLAGASLTTRKWARLLYVFAAIVSVPLMVATSSRFGLATLFVAPAMWIILRLRSHVTQAIAVVFALVGAVLILRFQAGSAAGDIAPVGAGGSYTINLLGLQIPADSSLLARWNLILNGLDMIAENPLGSGPGGYTVTAQAQGTSRMTFNITNPHNGVIEFFTQYGVLLGVVAVVVTIALLVLSVRANNASRRRTPERALASALACVIATLPLILTMNSSFVGVPHEWAGFATCAAVGIYLRTLHRSAAAREQVEPGNDMASLGGLHTN